MKNENNYIAKTLFGLEEILAEELSSLGAKDIMVLPRSVQFSGSRQMLYKVNFHSRLSTRILKPISFFKAAKDKDLYLAVSKIDWSKLMKVTQTFSIDSVIYKSPIKNSLYASQLTKDAIVDQFRKKSDRRPSIDLKNPDIRINLYINGSKATLSLDSSGEPLSRRGYRIRGGKAPLNEILATGMLALSEWDKQQPLLDPMCGSGTILVEAAMLAGNIAPGLLDRSYCFQNWPDFDKKAFKSVISDAEQAVDTSNMPEFYGADIDSVLLKTAKYNAIRAGVEKYINFSKQDFFKMNPTDFRGVIIFNPPYDSRLKESDIAAFYKSIGDSLKTNCSGNTAFFLSGNLPAIKSIGLRTSRKIKLYNGPIECRLIKIDLYQGSKKNK